MNKIIKIFTLIMILITQLSYSQFQQSWVARYDGPTHGSDIIGSNIGHDQYGNLYVTGNVYNGGSTGTDIATIKYNSSGTQQWAVTYNYSELDLGAAIAVDYITGDVYVTGCVVYNLYNDAYVTIKYNSNGVQQWSNFAGQGMAQPMAITLDQSGNVYVTGADVITGSGYNYLTVKYNSGGVLQWYNRYNGYGSGYDWANDIAVDGSGNVYVTGESVGNGTQSDIATVKYNSSGTQIWASRFNAVGQMDIGNTIELYGGTVYVVGMSYNLETLDRPGSGDAALLSYNGETGSLNWSKLYNRIYLSEESAIDMKVLYEPGFREESIFWAGTTYDMGTSQGKIMVAKYRSTGIPYWHTIYTDPQNYTVEATGIDADINGNTYVSSYIDRGEAFNDRYDFLILVFNSSGNLNWSATYNGPGNSNDQTYSIYFDPSVNNIYVSGVSMGSGTSWDYCLIKYTKIPDGGDNFISSQPHINNSPNPFNPETILNYGLTSNGFTKIEVFNMMGQLISTLVQEYQTAGEYNVKFTGNNLPSGIYFYRLTTPNFTKTEKMMLIK